MGRHRTSYKNSLIYAKELIKQGNDLDKACKLSAHRFDEKSAQIKRRLNKEEREKNAVKVNFYEGPIYLVNVSDKSDIKKQNIAIKLNTKFDAQTTKQYIEKFYTKNGYRAIIKTSDWSNLFKSFKNEKQYNEYIKNRES